MEKQNYLSNLSEFEGMSLRGIASKTGHHFNTVRTLRFAIERRKDKAGVSFFIWANTL